MSLPSSPLPKGVHCRLRKGSLTMYIRNPPALTLRSRKSSVLHSPSLDFMKFKFEEKRMAEYHRKSLIQEINIQALRGTNEAKFYIDHFFCSIPNVELVKELYQSWIRLSKQHKHNTLDLFLTEIMRTTPLTAPSTKPKRLAYYLIKAFTAWTRVQDAEGACGVDLFKLDPLQEIELCKTVTELQDMITEAFPSRSPRTRASPSSSQYPRSQASPLSSCNKSQLETKKGLSRGDTPVTSPSKSQSWMNNRNFGYAIRQSSGHGDSGTGPLGRIMLDGSGILTEGNVSIKRSHDSPHGSSSSNDWESDDESSGDDSRAPSVFAVLE